jgi:hypothetical protein
MPARPKIQCSKCEGRGEFDLPEVLCDTLLLVRKLGEPTIPELYAADAKAKNSHQTSVNRRLERLMEFGLVEKIGNGGRGSKHHPSKYREKRK